MGAVASVCQPSTLRMLIWPEASNAPKYNSIATYHPNVIERLHYEFKRRTKTQTALPSADTAACITSDDTPLNRLIGNELRRTSSVVLGMGFDNTPEGSLFRSFKQVEAVSTENSFIRR